MTKHILIIIVNQKNAVELTTSFPTVQRTVSLTRSAGCLCHPLAWGGAMRGDDSRGGASCLTLCSIAIALPSALRETTKASFHPDTADCAGPGRVEGWHPHEAEARAHLQSGMGRGGAGMQRLTFNIIRAPLIPTTKREGAMGAGGQAGCG